jgi:chromosome segregation ATPase
MPKSNFFSFQDIIMSVTGILIVVALMLALQIDRVTNTSLSQGISSDADPAATRGAELETLEENVATLKRQLEVLQGAARKTESEAELMAEVARLEERILGLSSRNSVAQNNGTGAADLAEIKTKAAEILRLREEIRKGEEAISRFSESATDAAIRMRELEQKVKVLEAAAIAARIKSGNLRLIRELSDTTKEPVIVDVGETSLKLMRFDQAQIIEVASLEGFHRVIRKFRKQDQYFVLYFRPDGARRFIEVRQAVKDAGFEVGYDAIAEGAKLSLGKEGRQ